jgi:hypothetical protein
LPSKRHTWHLERASGNALQARPKGPYDTLWTSDVESTAPLDVL